jgi:hypothetical protein
VDADGDNDTDDVLGTMALLLELELVVELRGVLLVLLLLAVVASAMMSGAMSMGLSFSGKTEPS